uniref:Cytokine receptor family protein B2 n=1 Tax=Siniperca chuatsi TaxID=119488 RepID=A0A3S5G6V9_SINCH|nr:cytokine receptor family protein B2 [Siniperca chuatsi]
MTALIWMLTWLPQVLPVVSELPQPVNVILTSNHFRHMLKWEHGPGTPTGVYYQVTVGNETGTSWEPVSGCERVQHPLVCNLTEALLHPKQVYHIQLTAFLEAQSSKLVHRRFQPIKDTHLDLPLLTVTPCGSDLCVDLHPPMEHLRKIYDSLDYKLRITSNSGERAQFFKDTQYLRGEILKSLARGRQYCVSVCFSDSLVSRESNYSQPVCAFTPGIYTADQLISAVLCLLVMSGVVVVALLVRTGFICLIKRPLPTVLTSIRHMEEVLVVAHCSTSLSSLLNLKVSPPSSGEKRSHQTFSDESDEESVTESTGGSRGGDYKLRVGTNLLSSSSSSSSSAPLSPEPIPPPSFSSNQTSDFFHPQPEPLISTETNFSAGLSHALSTHTASHSDSLPESDQRASDPCPPADTDTLTVGRIEPNEEEKEVVGEGDSQDVNLLTLTFGGYEEEVEEKPHLEMAEESFSASSVCEGRIGVIYNITPILPSQTWDKKEVAIEMVSCSVNAEEEEEEEEEEEHSGYMGRPCTDFSQNFL